MWSLVDTVLLYYYHLSLAWGGFLSVVPRRHSPPVLLSFIVGLGGFLSVVPRRHSPPILLSFIVGLDVS